MVCVFLKLPICLLNRAHTILFFPLHYLLHIFFWTKLCIGFVIGYLLFSCDIRFRTYTLQNVYRICYSFFFGFTYVWSLLSVILQSCFCWGIFFTTRSKLQDLHWIKYLAALHLVIFLTFNILLSCTNLCFTIKTFVGSSWSSSLSLDMKAPPASCFSFQYIEWKPLGMSDQQLLSGKSNIHFSQLFLSKGCGENPKWLMIVKWWPHGVIGSYFQMKRTLLIWKLKCKARTTTWWDKTRTQDSRFQLSDSSCSYSYLMPLFIVLLNHTLLFCHYWYFKILTF